MRLSRHRRRFAAARRGAIGAMAGLSLATAQNLLPAMDAEGPEDRDAPGLLDSSLLPDGGILKKVLIPQYDRNLVLTATLRADELEIITREMIDARGLLIEFFNPDRSPRGRIAMATARYDAVKQFLSSKEPVSLVSDDVTADGSSLVYDLKNTRGFLHGPVTAVVAADQSTSMNTRPARQALAAGVLLMATATALPAQEPSAATIAGRIAEARLSPGELARLAKDSESARALVEAAAGQGDQSLGESSTLSEEASATMAGFFRAATLTTLLAESGPATPPGDVPRPNIAPDPTKTRITSDDGAFFDSKNGLLIFLKNVVVRDPRLHLSGADEVKVFFDPKETAATSKTTPKVPAPQDPTAIPAADPPKPAATAPATSPAGNKPKQEAGLADARFGKPSRIIATGTVVVEYRSDDPKEPPVKASARTVIYDLKKSEFILRGGSPWILREGQLSSVPGNDAYIVIQKNGSFVTGNGGIDATMDTQGKDDAKDPKKP